MVTQLVSTVTQSPDASEATPVFRKTEYGIVVCIIACAYLASLIGVILLADDSESRLVGAAITTSIYTAVFALVTASYKPHYIPKFPVSPDEAARILVAVGAMMLALRYLLRRPTLDTFLEGVLIVVAAGFALFGVIEFIFLVAKRLPKEWPKYLLAYVLSLAGFAFALVFLVPILFKNSHTEQLLAQINAAIVAVLWMQVLNVLSRLCTKRTKLELIEDGYALVVMKNRRIKRIVIDAPSTEIRPKYESVMPVDVRVRKTAVHHECESKDHVKVYLDATCLWQVVGDEAHIRTFLTYAQEPDRALRDQLRAAISAEIGQRNSERLMEWQALIAERVVMRMRHNADRLGVRVRVVNLINMHTKFPTLAEGGAPSVEAERLKTIDPAVRRASPQTLAHVQKMHETYNENEWRSDSVRRS